MTLSKSNVFREVKKLIATNKLEQAKLALQPLITELNNDYRVFSLLGLIYHKQGLFSRAVKNYKRAMDINPLDPDTAINLSLIYNDLGKYDEGAQLYARAVGLIDNNENNNVNDRDARLDADLMFARQHLNLGELYLRYNRNEEALQELQKAMSFDPELESIHINMSECLARLGKRKQAIKNLRDLKLKRSDLLEARIKLGHMLFLEGELASAIQEWEDVLVLDPNKMEAKMYLKMAREETFIP
jgi:tetratricopeptide (TPR) repeat protein